MFYQFLSVFLNASSILLAKFSFGWVSENAFLMIYAVTFMLLALIHARMSDMVRYLTTRNGIATAVLNTLGTWCFYMGLEKLTPSTHSFIARSYIIFGMIISVLWFREKLTNAKVLVLVTCITGVALSSLPDTEGTVTLQAVIFTLLSSLLFALNYAVLIKKTQDIHPCVPLGVNGLFLFALAIFLSAGQGQKIFNGLDVLGTTCSVLSAAFIFYSMFSYIKTAGSVDFHVATALRALSPVVVTLISLPFYGYQFGQFKLTGELLVIVSIIAMGMTQTINRRVK